MKNNKLNTPKIVSKSNKPLLSSNEPVICPYCRQKCKNGPQLKRHVKKIHWQI